MFIGALWVLEQEQKVFEHLWGKAGLSIDQHPLETGSGTAVFSGAMIGAIAQTGYVGSLPYSRLMSVSGDLDTFVRRSVLNEPTGFSLSKGKITARFAKHRAGKVLAAKIGARFIPYAGWALFAVDMWHVGKWIGEKTNPFDS